MESPGLRRRTVRTTTIGSLASSIIQFLSPFYRFSTWFLKVLASLLVLLVLPVIPYRLLCLNLDDTNLHADRIQLWNDFNHAWLGLGQRQIDLMTSCQQLSRTQSLVSKAMIKNMGNELIRLCDGIERHGLVDYQYGVWEDQITAVLEDCLDLYDSSEKGSGSGNQ
ncbi:hypothetical protein HZ326_28849 [Fusarium oxysporum f. sp. albedinis]|nr:hypothetical protein HZ326_28849 [Fusarium oxysporum f. sp. albedinis]